MVEPCSALFLESSLKKLPTAPAKRIGKIVGPSLAASNRLVFKVVFRRREP